MAPSIIVVSMITNHSDFILRCPSKSHVLLTASLILTLSWVSYLDTSCSDFVKGQAPPLASERSTFLCSPCSNSRNTGEDCKALAEMVQYNWSFFLAGGDLGTENIQEVATAWKWQRGQMVSDLIFQLSKISKCVVLKLLSSHSIATEPHVVPASYRPDIKVQGCNRICPTLLDSQPDDPGHFKHRRFHLDCVCVCKYTLEN